MIQKARLAKDHLESSASARAQRRRGIWLLLAVLLVAQGGRSPGAEDRRTSAFPSFADRHTVALWLFDETEYPGTTLTDASRNEYDLRLLEGGTLAPGRFGNALKVLPLGSERRDTLYERFPRTPGIAVCYLSAPGNSRDDVRAILGGNSPPTSILTTLKNNDWTLECWLKLSAAPTTRAVLIDLGQGFEVGFRIDLGANAETFIISNGYSESRATCPTHQTRLADGQWHHAAFTHSAVNGLRHFVDGELQADSRMERFRNRGTGAGSGPPAWSEALERRFNISLGQDRRAGGNVEGLLDEFRLSDIERYREDFSPPKSFSRNHGLHAPRSAVPSGPPLLFGPDSDPGPVRLGSRKHVFIDDVLIETRESVEVTLNPPTDPRRLQPATMGLHGDPCTFDHNGRVWMMPGWISEDGVHFKESFKTPVRENAVIFLDGNPTASPEERYKLTATTNQGIYMYVSPDGVAWRRNETCMLPLVSGGGCESFWDDQRGLYVNFLKRDGSFHTPEYPRGGRSAPMFQTREPLKTWPFKVLKQPYYEGWAYPCVTGEGTVGIDKNENGQVYRTRAIKYPWAPDVYLAFAWRLPENLARQTDLGVSRDGVHWNFFAPTWYLSSGGTFEGHPVVEALAHYGWIRQGDEIWQYASYGYQPHVSGDAYVRLTQRLDGFVSLDADSRSGSLTTRPLIFEGDRLSLNVNARGTASVALLDEAGEPIPGYSLSDCDPIQTDSVRHIVTWRGSPSLGRLAGHVVQLRIRMRETKLYALKFSAAE